MAISANKVRGIRAAVAHDPYSLERSVRSNDCQVLCMGANVIAPALARSLLASWLDHRFDPTSPSEAKVAVIRAYEAQDAPDGSATE
jgi:ribose 5-phosphate isomerase B